MLRLIAMISAGLLVAALLAGCGDTLIDNGDGVQYRIDGLLFFNPNANTSFCYSVFEADNQPLTQLIVKLDSTQLIPIGGGAYLTQAGGLSLAGDSVYLFRGSTFAEDFQFQQQINVADTFSITSIDPANRIYTPASGAVSIDWNPSARATGYFVTVVSPSAQTVPYAKFATAGSTSFSIEPEAFRTSAGVFIPGKYKLYVVAYRETFYSDGVTKNADRVFFPYPATGFSDNINRIGVKGRFGSVTLSYPDSITAVSNP